MASKRRAFMQQYALIAIFAVVYLVIGFLVRNSYYQLMMTLVLIWGTMGLGWNVLSGYSGMISFGHAAFFGLGAYTVTIAFVKFGITPWLGIPLGVLVGVIAGVLIGIPTFRLRGHYFALSMLAYPLAMLYVFEWLGYQEVSLPMKRENPIAYMQFTDQRAYMVISMIVMVACMIISLHVERSRFGRSLLAIKQNQPAAEAAGINATRWKMYAMMLSAGMAAAAGGLYAIILLVVTPQTVFGALVSAQALIVALFGGVGIFWGPVIGAGILIPLAETLNAELGHILPGIQGVVYGLAIIVIILVAPDGIYWKVRDRVLARRATPAKVGVQPRLAEQISIAADAAPVPRPAFGQPILQLDGVSRSFGGLKAVDDVTLSVPEGVIYGIIGPNGAGKTTLFNVLNGFLAADKGSMRFADTEIGGLKPHEVCACGVGRTFQVVRSFPRMTVLENVVIGAFVGSKTDDEAVAARLRGARARRIGRPAGPCARRWTDHQATPPDGACARARAASQAAAARRDARRPRTRRARRYPADHPAGEPRKRYHRDHRAHHACHGKACGSFQRARPWPADRERHARRRGQESGGDRSLSRQEVDASC